MDLVKPLTMIFYLLDALLPDLSNLPDLSDLLDSLVPNLSDLLPDPNPALIPPFLLGYTLTWHDEFHPAFSSGPNPHQPSSSSWIYDIGTSYPGGAPAWGNNELQTYTTDPSNIALTPAHTLTITPRLDPATDPENGNWTSARIETSQLFAASPGGSLYIETRLRTGCAPTSQQSGIWPAFWALGETFRADPTYWPMASEWDIVEVINGEPTIYNTLHCGRDEEAGGPCNEFNGLGNGGVPWEACEWHVVGFLVDRSSTSNEGDDGDWKEEKLRWFVDGRQTWEVTGADVGDYEVWERVAHDGHFLLLNVAVGGNWPGYPDENTVDGEEVQMEVDYVRVWNLE
ncbi:concanavalin A-like lectin/glucanase domain-containing protein [Aspergillus egyptiacus]|nr:concanavalin A-like lectin/glucanase domain-containing protein [Aspergillus egyptiacus]